MCSVEVLKQHANFIMKRIIEHGYEAYLVGGYVRDKWLNRPVNDVDIATSALPEQVAKLFSHTIPTGIQHGTVTVIINDLPFEVTTFRKEAQYENYRRPLSVDFISNLTEDLQRRDFTMNAMALDIEGNWIDPFRGRTDLELGIVRCVGNPQERFEEDALRMLRCIRFAAEYELAIESNTWQALLSNRMLLKHIAMERVRIELDKMINGRSAQTALTLLAESELLRFVKAQHTIKLEQLDRSELGKLGSVLSQITSDTIKWAVLMVSLQISSSEADCIMRNFTFSNTLRQSIERMLLFYESFSSSQQAALDWKQEVLQYGEVSASQWLLVFQILHKRQIELLGFTSRTLSIIAQNGLHWIDEMSVTSLKQLAVSGTDLIKAGIKPGPQIGNILEKLLYDTALNELPNEYDTLMNEVKKYMQRLDEREQ